MISNTVIVVIVGMADMQIRRLDSASLEIFDQPRRTHSTISVYYFVVLPIINNLSVSPSGARQICYEIQESNSDHSVSTSGIPARGDSSDTPQQVHPMRLRSNRAELSRAA